MSLSERLRPDVECAGWVLVEVKALEAELAAEKAKVLAAQHRLVCDPKDLRVAGLETAVMFWQDKWALYDRRAKELASAQLTIEKMREALEQLCGDKCNSEYNPCIAKVVLLENHPSLKALEIDRLEQRINESSYYGGEDTERAHQLNSQLDELKKGE